MRSSSGLLLPSRCPACLAIGQAPCAACASLLLPPRAVPAGVRTAFSYEGPARELLARIKYRNHRDAIRFLASEVAALFAPDEVDLATWAPTTADRRRSRGFDHAELLAREVARTLGVPCRPTLRRLGTRPQTGSGRRERLAGPEFVALTGVAGGRIAVIDDVVTTGSTLRAARHALETRGALRVVLAAAASTPPRSDGTSHSVVALPSFSRNLKL